MVPGLGLCVRTGGNEIKALGLAAPFRFSANKRLPPSNSFLSGTARASPLGLTDVARRCLKTRRVASAEFYENVTSFCGQ